MLLFLTGPMAYLPVPALAAVILMSAVRFIDIRGIVALYQRRASEGLIATAALLGVLAYGTLAGVAIAVLLATLNVFRRAALPQIVELGRVPGTTHFANLERWTDAARVEGVAVLRFSGALFFANAGALRDRILEIVTGRPGLHAVVVDIRAISDIDITAVDVLAKLVERLDAAGVALMLVRPSRAVRAELVAGGLGARLEADAPVAVGVAEAIEHLGLDLDRLADVAEGHARAAEQRAEAAPFVVANRYAITRSSVARAAVALGGFALIVAAGAVLLRPGSDENPSATLAGAVAVPNVIGLSEARAEAVVTGAGLVFGDPITVRLPDRAEGTVVGQDPGAGTSVEAGSTLVATISTQRQLVVVPDLVGLDQAAALVELSDVGLRLTGVEEVAVADVPAGQILTSHPVAGTTVAAGSGVDITVAAAPDATTAQPTRRADDQPLTRAQAVAGRDRAPRLDWSTIPLPTEAPPDMSRTRPRLPRVLATSGLILSIAFAAAACSAAATPSASSAPAATIGACRCIGARRPRASPPLPSSAAPAGTVCDDVAAFEASADALSKVDVTAGGAAALAAAIGDFKTSAEALKASASTELASSVDAMTTKLDAVQTAVSQLGQDQSASAILAVGTALKDLATAAQDLDTQFKNACP